MSSNHYKIKEALDRKGYAPIHIEYVRPFAHPEMCGMVGGWTVIFEPDGYFDKPKNLYSTILAGYNIAQILDQIDKLPDAILKPELQNLIGEWVTT